VTDEPGGPGRPIAAAVAPLRVTLPGPGGRRRAVTVTVTVTMVTGWVDTQLSSIQTAVQLPATLHALALGQWSQVVSRAGLTTADLIGGPVSLQAATLRCSDAWAAMNPATIARQGPSVFASGDVINARGLRALCAVWPHDAGASGTVRSDVPIVFLNGTADPGDPPSSVAGATATMPNALLVSVPGVAHWTLNWSPDPVCLLAATAAFIRAGRPARPAAWDACTRALAAEPMPFPAP
jgi:pimeloyl-ACP methyl ester carboxylesterase